MKLLTSIMLFFVCTHVFATVNYDCNFDSFSNGKTLDEEDLKLTFLLDDISGKAYIIGNNGSKEVAYIFNDEARTFIEITDTGNVMTTTITSKLEAVHSRNSVIFGKLIPSQYYGSCISK
ncbi:hypothetical protein VH441_04900 [Psychrobacter sp. HD31]|uniref:hypothetical protein n=1 Tax=Psychrobacter sp. HD31 TaxID=3112003 RepID=UPI003DA544FE